MDKLEKYAPCWIMIAFELGVIVGMLIVAISQ